MRALVAFAQYGTLSAAADELHVTQPTLTRATRRLEQDLGVALFDRSAKNRLTLTPTGELAANEARTLLDAYEHFITMVCNDARLRDELVIESVAPGPLRFIESIRDRGDGDDDGGAAWRAKVTIRPELIEPSAALDELLLRKATIIITDREIDDPRVASLYLGRETLAVAIDNFNPLAQRGTVTFDDLAGMSFIVVQDIGPWKALVETHIPDAQFLYQQDLTALEELSRYSVFPFFYSNLTRGLALTDGRFATHARTEVAIDDPANRIDFYATFLSGNRDVALPIQQHLAQHWPRER